MQEGRGRGLAVPGPGSPVAGAGDDDREGIAARPAGPADDLLDHRRQVRAPLVRSDLPGRQSQTHECRTLHPRAIC